MRINELLCSDFVWSFSRLNAYHTCPYMFYLQYIEKLKGIDNAFGQFGTHCHGILERYFKKELSLFDLSYEYTSTYNKNVTEKFPWNKYKDLKTSYFNAGREYFDNFKGFDNYEILAVEKEILCNVDKYKFTGYIDLIIRNKNNQIIMIDHKSKSKFKSKKEFKEYLRQLYLYCIAVYEEYGEYPAKLFFNMFKEKKWEGTGFDINALEEAKQWVVSTIDKIMKTEKFSPLSNDFYCRNICGQRLNCGYYRK